MKINEIIKNLPYDKMDCKITNNGLLWLRKGGFNERFQAYRKLAPFQQHVTKNSRIESYKKHQQKMLNEPKYFEQYSGEHLYKQKIIEAKSKPKKQYYKINKRKVRARITNFLNTDKGMNELFFYTITFPPVITEDIAYRLLNSILTSIRKAVPDYSYLWIAEKQKNNTIHYHIASFKYIKVQVINTLVKKNLQHEIRKGNLNWNIVNSNRYNGVDIAKDRRSRIPTNFAKESKAKAIASYITKYISKSEQKFKRKAWSCSTDMCMVSDSIRLTTKEAVVLFDELIDWDNCLFTNEFCEFYRWKKEVPDIVVETLKIENNRRLSVN